MSLRSFVESQVDFAFEQIGDLKTMVVFSGKESTEYNHASGEVEISGAAEMVALGVVESNYSTISGEGHTVYHMDILFNKKEMSSVSKLHTFDHVTVNNTTHPIINFVDDGYTVTVTVSLR